MRLIGFSFSKIEALKNKPLIEAPKVGTSINILDMNEIDSKMFSSEESALEVEFGYEINYNKDVANFNFKGKMHLLGESKEIKNLVSNWKDKEVSDEVKTMLFNIIFRKVNLKAAQLEEELGVPIHFRMPSLKISSENSKEEKKK
ncbi:MAG: hypothetical protein KC516_04475 [Nanoarchaeota archaeon]|nr:hypothetical protein [Nanoarchaeota archaeon]